MEKKITTWNLIFPKTIGKGLTINRTKKRIFVLYCNDNKLNWILFRNLIVRTRVHFQLEPIWFKTDSLGLNDIDDVTDINPYNPLFNILSSADLVWKKNDIIHKDIKSIKYSIFWEMLENLKNDTNLLLFTDNKNELKQIVTNLTNENSNLVIIHLFNKEDIKKDINYSLNDACFKKIQIWKLKYKKTLMNKFDDKSILQLIGKWIYFKRERKLKSIRNKICAIMNEYYLRAIIPSYYDDEIEFENRIRIDDEIIELLYDK